MDAAAIESIALPIYKRTKADQTALDLGQILARVRSPTSVCSVLSPTTW